MPMRADDQEVDRVAAQVADQLAGGVGPVEQDRPSSIPAFMEGFHQVRQVTLVGL